MGNVLHVIFLYFINTQAGVLRYTGRCGSIHRQVWFDTQAGVLRYTGRCGSIQVWFDTQAGVLRVEHLLLHKGDTNNVFIVVYYDTDIVYCVPCGVCHNTLVLRCIVPALLVPQHIQILSNCIWVFFNNTKHAYKLKVRNRVIEFFLKISNKLSCHFLSKGF